MVRTQADLTIRIFQFPNNEGGSTNKYLANILSSSSPPLHNLKRNNYDKLNICDESCSKQYIYVYGKFLNSKQLIIV